MKKRNKMLAAGLVMTIFTVGCQTENEQISPVAANQATETIQSKSFNGEGEITRIEATYLYGNTQYQLSYTLDEANNLSELSGDMAQHEALLSASASNENMAFWVEKSGGRKIIIRVFDSYEEMGGYQERNAGARQTGRCDSWSTSGEASFYFYKHTNYAGEFVDIRRENKAYFQDQYLVYENDQISSLQLDGPTGASVDLFEHSCFFRPLLRTTIDIPNLHAFFVYYNGQFRPVGDVTSSLKGWSL